MASLAQVVGRKATDPSSCDVGKLLAIPWDSDSASEAG